MNKYARRDVKLLRSTIFYPLFWLRKPFLLVGKVFGGFFFVGAVLVLFLVRGEEQFWSMFLTCTIMSFVFFMMNQFYDQILLKLNPTGSVLVLTK